MAPAAVNTQAPPKESKRSKEPALKKKRTFHLVNSETYEPLGPEYKGTTPSQAAQKAASAGHTDIALLEKTVRGGGKVYQYKGEKRKLTDAEQNEHTRKYNITDKAKATRQNKSVITILPSKV